MVHFQELERPVAGKFVAFQNEQSDGCAGGGDIEGTGTLCLGQRASIEIHVSLVESEYKCVFALTPFHTVEGGEDQFSLDHLFVNDIRFEHRDMARNTIVHQYILQFAYLAIGAFHRRTEDEKVAGMRTVRQQFANMEDNQTL